MKLTFLGATRTVTGSKYLLTFHSDFHVLVDCGLFQGQYDLRRRNWNDFPIDPEKINTVILTHAHLDHSGYLPLLVKNGFKGKIYSTHATFDLCSILLPDSGYIQEEDARRANKYQYTKHNPAVPLYTQEEAKACLAYFEKVDFGQRIELEDEIYFEYHRAGHILGAAHVTIAESAHKKIVFSGDIGRLHDPVMKAPAHLHDADYVVMESTYGNSLHNNEDPTIELERLITQTITEKGGTLLIPAFAVGRAQQILYYLHKLQKEGKIQNIPIYLDSPMAINATSLLQKHKSDHRLSEELCAQVCQTANYVRTVEESKGIEAMHMPCILLTASGMATGGRVLHHLKYYLPDDKNTVLFTGFQASGTRGDRLVKGEKKIKIHGEFFPVRARIENITSLSAHADYQELLSWLSYFKPEPAKIFLSHGEYETAQSFQKKVQEAYGESEVVIPDYLEEFEL